MKERVKINHFKKESSLNGEKEQNEILNMALELNRKKFISVIKIRA